MKKIERVELGDRVKDKISGLKGIAEAITEFLYGCRRVLVRPEETKDGKPIDATYVDEPQLTVTKKAAIKSQPEKRPTRHGSRDNAHPKGNIAKP